MGDVTPLRIVHGREVFITKRDVAELLTISVSTVERLAALPFMDPDRIPSRKIGGVRRYLASEVWDWANMKGANRAVR